MKYALSADQITDAVVAYLEKHGYKIADGDHSVEVMASNGEGWAKINFSRRTPVAVELVDPTENPTEDKGSPT